MMSVARNVMLRNIMYAMATTVSFASVSQRPHSDERSAPSRRFEFSARAARAERKKEHAQDEIDPHRWKITGASLGKVFVRQASGPQQQRVHRLPEPAVDLGDGMPGVVKQCADRTGTRVPVLNTTLRWALNDTDAAH